MVGNVLLGCGRCKDAMVEARRSNGQNLKGEEGEGCYEGLVEGQLWMVHFGGDGMR